MEGNTFQRIYDMIEDLLPDEWEELFFYAMYEHDSYSMRFYVRRGDDVRHMSNIEGIQQKVVIDRAMKIDRFLQVERNSLSDPWRTLTMVVDNNGKFFVDLDYTDFSERYLEYIEVWEEKYLRLNAAKDKPNSFND